MAWCEDINNKENEVEWRKDKAPNSIGEVLFLGPWNVGGVHYDSLCYKDDVMKYTATCKLPGVKWPGKFQTAKEAKVAVEYSVKHWLSQLPCKPDIFNATYEPVR
jgi:hypothetical protein